jgi:hypothetical protein
MGPLSGVVLSSVQKSSAGSGSGLYGTVTQIANAAGIAVVGAVFFAFHDVGAERVALLAALATVAAALIGCGGCLVLRSEQHHGNPWRLPKSDSNCEASGRRVGAADNKALINIGEGQPPSGRERKGFVLEVAVGPESEFFPGPSAQTRSGPASICSTWDQRAAFNPA